ncbi:MAG: repressor LexA [Chloroflexi bacterium]|nr:repressor LexA [Chloroflexota bacterium]
MGAKQLSDRQERMLRVIRDYTQEYGYPPTFREIGELVGISSTSVVSYNLKVLQREGYLARDRDVSRGLRLIATEEDGPELSDYAARATVSVPLLGVIGAGTQVSPRDNDWLEPALGFLSVPRDMIRRTEGLYAVRVQGDSMIEDLIADGDIVVLRYQETAEDGDTVAAWLKREEIMTLKEFHRESEQRRIRLQPRNPLLKPIYAHPDDVEIQGKVVTVIRQLE